MKFTIYILIALIAGAFAAHLLLAEQGYMMLTVGGYIIEMSLPVLVITLVLIYLLVRLIVYLLRAPGRLGEATARFQQHRKQDRLTRGLLELSEGNYARGERLLTSGGNDDTAVVGYLAAARAAQHQGDLERRNRWLDAASGRSERTDPATLLTKAELQIAEGDTTGAQATVDRLLEKSPGNKRALVFKAELAERDGCWNELMELLPKLRGVVPDERYDELSGKTWKALLSDAEDTETLDALWNSIPRKSRSIPVLATAYASTADRLGQKGDAEKHLRHVLNNNWDPELVRTYGEIEGPDPMKQLQHAESWLDTHGDDPDLLMTASRLCMRNELWGKSRSYLESSIGLRPTAEGYQLYGKLMDRLGESDSASVAFRSGLALATEQTARDIPALTGPIKLGESD